MGGLGAAVSVAMCSILEVRTGRAGRRRGFRCGLDLKMGSWVKTSQKTKMIAPTGAARSPSARGPVRVGRAGSLREVLAVVVGRPFHEGLVRLIRRKLDFPANGR